MESFVDLNAFAVQYRYESLYGDEEPIERADWLERIERLIGQAAAAIRG